MWFLHPEDGRITTTRPLHEETSSVGRRRTSVMADKEQYVSEVEEKMTEWDRRIEEIIEKAEESDKDSVLVKDLLAKQQEAKTRFEQLQGADDAQYEDLKGRVSVATQALQDVLVRTSEQFQLGNPRPASGSTRPGQEGQQAGQRQAQPSSGAGQKFGGASSQPSGRGESGAGGNMPASQRPTMYQEKRDTNTSPTAPQPGGSTAEKNRTTTERGATAGKEPVGEARPGEAQKRKSTQA